MTRGLAEITRLAVARGANFTLAGLAGMGDLTLTAREIYLEIVASESLSGKETLEFLCILGQVAEGIIFKVCDSNGGEQQY